MSRLCGLGVHGLFCALADCGAFDGELVRAWVINGGHGGVGWQARKRRDITCVIGFGLGWE